ncbi:Pycsar system effector family protein [Stenotrophomonas maltophilia]|uniref:Pycsar system effector family protein n=1 Tax=Stenotrophomonas maltophilia TaxID=40324 RepID=UPI0015C54A76|nr:Pycsar system effector family protein [Stenotrophomonas maltophilia]
MDQDELIAHLRWVLERQLHWIGAADVKAGGMIGAYMALAAIAATLLDSASPPATAKLLFIFAAIAMVPALVCAVLVFFPRDASKRRSSIFFREIADLEIDRFMDAARRQTTSQVIDDLLGQIHINAGIASTKHDFAKHSIVFGAASLALWVLAVATFMVKS